MRRFVFKLKKKKFENEHYASQSNKRIRNVVFEPDD